MASFRAHTQILGARLPRQQKFSQWHLIFVGPHFGACLKQAPKWGPTNIRCHSANFCCLGNLAPRICVCML